MRYFKPWHSLLSPGRRVATRWSMRHKLLALLGLPLVAVLACVLWVWHQAWQGRTEVLQRLQGLEALVQVQRHQAEVQQQRLRLTAPALLSAAMHQPQPGPWVLDPVWQLQPQAQAAAACVHAGRTLQETPPEVASFIATQAQCLDRLDSLALAIAQRSGLVRSPAAQGYHLVEWWLHHGLALHRAADHMSTLLGRPSAAAHLAPDDMASWTQPHGLVARELAGAAALLAEARRDGQPVPAGFEALQQALQAQRQAIDIKLALGDLVPEAELPARAQAVQATAEALRAFDSALYHQLQRQLQGGLQLQQQRLLGIGAAAALLLGLCGYLAAACAAVFMAQIHSVRACLARLTHGDLSATAEVLGRDETGVLAHDINEMGARLRGLVARLSHSAACIAGLGDALSMGAQSLALRSEEQARSVEASALAIQSAAGSAQSSAGTAAEVHALSQRLSAQASEGAQQVAQAVHTMQRIQQRAEQMSQALEGIEAITLQTRLLSLNATIEAAHAGSAGRGFAMVASEVRALADRTAEVAGQIQQMITSSGHEITQGLQQFRRIEALSQEVAVYSLDTADKMNLVAGQSAAQSAAMHQVHGALEGLASITSANLAMVTASVGEAETIRGHAEDLQASARQLSHKEAA